MLEQCIGPNRIQVRIFTVSIVRVLDIIVVIKLVIIII